MREWAYLHDEIRSVLAEQRLWPGRKTVTHNELPKFTPHADISPALYAAIHRSILAGFLTNIAAHKEKNQYAAAKNREVVLWPGSVLSGKSAPWIVATEVVKTSRLFARQAARIDAAWLEDLGGSLCKRSYSDAAWDRARGEVVAKERVSLFGLEILRDRRVSYGRINPSEAHDIFMMSALVEGDVGDPPPFLRHNLALQRKVEAMEEKLRRRDILVPEAKIAGFYSERLPGIFDIRSLRKLIRDRGEDFLCLKEEDLLNYNPDDATVSSFPDTVEVAGRPFKALYKFAPGEEDDGVTLSVPVSLLNAIPPARLEWGVPGHYKDKIAALIKGLPKRYRKLLVPVAEKAETIAAEMPRAPEEVPLARAVAEFVRRRFGADIPAREWALAEVPKYLRMRVAVIDPETGRVIDTGRDVDLLRKKISAADAVPSKVDSPAWVEARQKWEKSGLTAWTFGDLPEKIAVGTSLTAYPALVVEVGASSVGIRLFPTRAEAEAVHRQGVRWLLMQKFAKEMAFVRRYHKIPAEDDRAALAFGGRDAVERAIEAALAREIFERDLRTEAEFRAYESEVGRTLFEKGHVLTQTTVKILGLHHTLRTELGRGGLAAQRGPGAGPKRTLSLNELSRLKEPVAPAYFDEITRDLGKLLPKDFLEAYPIDRIVLLPRYLEAMKVRLERARIDPDKDKAKAAQVEPYGYALERLETEMLSAGAEPPISANLNLEKRRAVDELRRMIEEFKISLFAPEIRTAFPISAVRLARKIKEIEAMV
jgi:ATP-dependent helicase HrpA